ncbi:hypothetical protein TB1_023980 [Malus domestica]
MKSWSRILAALALAISMVFSTWPNVATAEARPLASDSAAASEADFSTSSQGLKDLEADKKKNPNKQIGSSFRRIPPSTPNPTQNKTSRNQEHRKPKHKLAAMAGEGAVIPLGKKAEADPGLAAIAAHYNGPETITARPNSLQHPFIYSFTLTSTTNYLVVASDGDYQDQIGEKEVRFFLKFFQLKTRCITEQWHSVATLTTPT